MRNPSIIMTFIVSYSLDLSSFLTLIRRINVSSLYISVMSTLTDSSTLKTDTCTLKMNEEISLELSNIYSFPFWLVEKCNRVK